LILLLHLRLFSLRMYWFGSPSPACGPGAPGRRVLVAPRMSLCTVCAYAHLVRGHVPGEVLTFCGYASPQREVPFPVRECTDHRPKRERHGAEIAIEGAVSLLPLEEVAEDFGAVTAMRNGEGE
jgi:hypothetical protein